MSHHQEHRYDGLNYTLSISPVTQQPSNNMPTTDEEESALDADEPPDHGFFSSRTSPSRTSSGEDYSKQTTPHPNRKASLLTQALLTSPNLQSAFSTDSYRTSWPKSDGSTHSTASVTSAAELTSDGGMTSPARTNTPSPPLPSTNHNGLSILTQKDLIDLRHVQVAEPTPLFLDTALTLPQPTAVVAGDAPVRKRCITFACGGPANAKADVAVKHTAPTEPATPKRSCMLRFACPAKPTKDLENELDRAGSGRPKPLATDVSSETTLRQHSNSQSTITDVTSDPLTSTKPKKSNLYSIHDYASSRDQEESWLNEKPRLRQKITVADTLRKENAIRKLGEEAEAEALQEEEEEEEQQRDDDDDDDDEDKDDEDEDDDLEDDEDNGSDDVSDGGNESDDEEGFADSDDENEDHGDYQFWTTGITPSATSVDHAELIRSRPQRNVSLSSIESIISANTNAIAIRKGESRRRHRHRRSKASPKMRPGTPELPDSTDFVCGTLDEDRPLEAAYLSCLEQRKIAKHGVIPQDFDPSFPTSDLDEDEEAGVGSDGHNWVAGRPDDSDGGHYRGRGEKSLRKVVKSPIPSPKRLRSPPPQKRHGGRMSPPPVSNKRGHCRSPPPPPQRLFGHSPRRMQSPPPNHRHLKSPPSSRRQSFSEVKNQAATGINMPHLGERPNLTHTKSLPRTPNPFWREHRKSRIEALNRVPTGFSSNTDGVDGHSRGPIDIVQGLETKKLRRKEKYWRQHCRNAGKEKDRRCQPGKGAERMRELGLEMAGRCKGYGQRVQLVLSV